MATIYIPAMWRDLTGGVDRAAVDATTLGEVIDQLESRFPGMRERACEGDGIAPHLAVSIDGAIVSRGRLARVGPQSEIHFLPAIGGG